MAQAPQAEPPSDRPKQSQADLRGASKVRALQSKDKEFKIRFQPNANKLINTNLVNRRQLSVIIALKYRQRPANVRRHVLVHDHARVPNSFPLLLNDSVKQWFAIALPAVGGAVHAEVLGLSRSERRNQSIQNPFYRHEARVELTILTAIPANNQLCAIAPIPISLYAINNRAWHVLGRELAYVLSRITLARSRKPSPAAHIWPEPEGGSGRASAASASASVSALGMIIDVEEDVLDEELASFVAGEIRATGDSDLLNPIVIEYRAAIANIASSRTVGIGCGSSDFPLCIEIAGEARSRSVSVVIGDEPRLALASPGGRALSPSSYLQKNQN